METVAASPRLDLRAEALRLLTMGGSILETAREVSLALADLEARTAVVGGVAVVLHGYIRTTVDVDVFVDGPLEEASARVQALGFLQDPTRREFRRQDVPIHFVTTRQVTDPLHALTEIEGVRTVSLEDLIAIKLRSGSANLLRAIDLADVIGLARVHRLSSSFAARLPKDLRPAFRRIVRAIDSEGEST